MLFKHVKRKRSEKEVHPHDRSERPSIVTHSHELSTLLGLYERPKTKKGHEMCWVQLKIEKVVDAIS